MGDKAPRYLNVSDRRSLDRKLRRAKRSRTISYFAVRRVTLMDRWVRSQGNNRYLNVWVYRKCLKISVDDMPEQFGNLLSYIYKRQGVGDYDVLQHTHGRLTDFLHVFTVDEYTISIM